MTSNDSAMTTGPADVDRGFIVVILWLPIGVFAFASAWFVFLTGMSVAACGDDRCDYAAAYAAQIGSWIGLALTTVLALVTLIATRARAWRNWWLTVAAIVVSALIVSVARSSMLSAFGVM